MERSKESASLLFANRESFADEENLPHLLLANVAFLSHSFTQRKKMMKN